MRLLPGALLLLLASAAPLPAQSLNLNCPYGRAQIAQCQHPTGKLTPRMPQTPEMATCTAVQTLPNGADCRCGRTPGKIMRVDGLQCNPPPPPPAVPSP